jgi:hypothetical protein
MEQTLGQITDEIYNAVKNYHIASMGNDSREIADAQAEYAGMISIYGAKAVANVVEYYNETVIRKAK